KLADPWRRPSALTQTVFSPIGSWLDKLRMTKLRRDARRGDLDALYGRADSTSLERLKQTGFSDDMIEAFFRPFLGGVFLEWELDTSSRMLEFVFRMFSSGPIAIPADGMSAIPRQLAERLERGSLLLEHAVEA